MELRHIRYFLAVAEERNFTRAAGKLNIAQSPLSQQIRQLEREVGVPLLTRTTRSVSLTYAGEVFYERTRALLADAAAAAEDARKAARGELGSLAVGFTGSATYEFLPTLVRAYADRYPEVTLQVHSDMVTPRQTEQLLDGRLSVGVLRPPVTVSGNRRRNHSPRTGRRHPRQSPPCDGPTSDRPLRPPRRMVHLLSRQPAVHHVHHHANRLRNGRIHSPHPPGRRRQRSTRRPRRRRHGHRHRPRITATPADQRRHFPPPPQPPHHHQLSPSPTAKPTSTRWSDDSSKRPGPSSEAGPPSPLPPRHHSPTTTASLSSTKHWPSASSRCRRCSRDLTSPHSKLRLMRARHTPLTKGRCRSSGTHRPTPLLLPRSRAESPHSPGLSRGRRRSEGSIDVFGGRRAARSAGPVRAPARRSSTTT